jgi:hypothetical protein
VLVLLNALSNNRMELLEDVTLPLSRWGRLALLLEVLLLKGRDVMVELLCCFVSRQQLAEPRN